MTSIRHSDKPEGTAITTTIVIDDQDDIRYLISQIIEMSDHTLSVVAEAANGEEAIAILRDLGDDVPAVVVTDWMMPGMNGIETVRHIKLRRPNARFIMCSAFADETLERRAVEAGVDRFFSKDQINQIPGAIRELGQTA